MKRISLESKILFPNKWKNENCWIWLGSYNRNYPAIYVSLEGKPTAIRIRRLMWEINIVDNGESPLRKDDIIVSVCKNDSCVNPLHLIRYTKAEAFDLGWEYLQKSPTASREKFAKITHCPRGHEYTLENTGYATGKWATNRARTYVCRWCKTCNRERMRERSRRKGATRLENDYEGKGLLTTEVMDREFKRTPRTF